MASADDQAARNRDIATAYAAGESIEALASKFELSVSRTRTIAANVRPAIARPAAAMRLARERREQYRETVAELHDLARRLPLSQASSKVGAYRVLLEALEALTRIESATGYLPTALDDLAYQQTIATTVLEVLDGFELPAEAIEELSEKLGVAA